MTDKKETKLISSTYQISWTGKFGGEALDRLLKNFEGESDENLLVGMESWDDAGIYRLSDKLALVQTVDFISAVVDDPYIFGQIAVSHALNNIYAMGTQPVTALNIVGYPTTELPMPVLGEILQGGLEKAKEAEVMIMGGHSVKDAELKYGLAASAMIDPNEILRNNGAHVGEQLILTKPLGTGILLEALKKGELEDDLLDEMGKKMSQLHKKAVPIMKQFGATAATDVSSAGLLGNLHEMTRQAGYSIELHTSQLPIMREVLSFSKAEMHSLSLQENRKYYEPHIEWLKELDESLKNLLFDPQTSGGLLFTLPSENLDNCLEALREAGFTDAAHIGQIIPKREVALLVG